MDAPYVILVKARPTDDTLYSYMTGADTRNETNTLTLQPEKMDEGKTTSQQVTVNSGVLKKRWMLLRPFRAVL